MADHNQSSETTTKGKTLDDQLTGIKLRKAKKKALRAFLVILAVLVALAAAAAAWQWQNIARARSVIGSWYCINDGMLYAFASDGSFAVKIGQIDVITGSWQAGLKKDQLILKYEKNDNIIHETVEYRLEKEQKTLHIDNMDGQDLTMNRQKDKD